MTDSYHFESVPKFRVGGVYRDVTNSLVRLESACEFDGENGWARASIKDDNVGEWRTYSARFRLSDGRWHGEFSGMHLAPGELVERNGQWVAADAPIGPFGSGATLKTSGDKIVGRVEASPATYNVSVGNRLMPIDELHDALRAVLDSLYAAPKTQRAPLPNSDEWRGIGHKAHDTFGPDFIVTKGEVPTAPLHDSPTTDSAYPAIAGLLRGQVEGLQMHKRIVAESLSFGLSHCEYHEGASRANEGAA